VLNNPVKYTDPSGYEPKYGCYSSDANTCLNANGTTITPGNGESNNDHDEEDTEESNPSPSVVLLSIFSDFLNSNIGIGPILIPFESSSSTNSPYVFTPAQIELTVNMAEDDRKLSPREIEELKKKGVDIHGEKGGKGTGARDLFVDKKGRVLVKPKDGSGEGEDTGININDD